MAWTNWGFDGTINEAQWAQMAGLLGNGYVAAGNGDCAVTAVSGQRKVSVAAGTLFGDGVVSVNSGAEEVTLTTPTNGQWYVIALRRTWATNTVALVAIAGATTTTSIPSTPPGTFPTLNTNVGVLTDQPIAWAWCNSATTDVVVSDLRAMPLTSQIVTDRARIAAVESVDSTQNGRLTTLEARPLAGLVPLVPSAVYKAPSGSISANAAGEVTFTGTEAIVVAGVFSSAYRNYRMEMITGSTVNGEQIRARYTVATVANTAANYYQAGVKAMAAASPTQFGGNTQTFITLAQSASSGNWVGISADFYAPNVADHKRVTSHALGHDGTITSDYTIGCLCLAADAYDGVYLFPASGVFSGTVKFYGYN